MKDLEKIKRAALPILIQCGAKKAAVFGSMVKGRIHPKSDIDILVEIKEEKTLLDFISLKLKLENALKMKVDLVEYGTIKPLLRKNILEEQVVIYEEKHKGLH